ncbi:MAG: helix-turn-helix transcriptional regulator [Pseudomonadota bacterium]
MTQRMFPSNIKSIITSDSIAFKKIREEFLKIDRHVAAVMLNCSYKTIERYENGRGNFTQKRISKWLLDYGVSQSDYTQILEGKINEVKTRYAMKSQPKVLENNSMRRSYQRFIDKRVLTLICLRKLKAGFTQYQASEACGYVKCTIGHIENGRIELDDKRIAHIVKSYGYTMDDYTKHLKSEKLITDLIEDCLMLIKAMPEDKILIVHPMLKSLHS